MSKYKGQTGNTPPLSSDSATEAGAQPSEQSAGMTTAAKSTPSMTTTPKQSAPILTTGKSVSEKSIMAAQVMRAVLSRLEKDGLIRRYRLLSAGKTVKEIRIVFDNSVWDENLNLRLLSEADNA